MITELVIKIYAGSMVEAARIATERLGLVEAIVLWNESQVHKGAGEFIAYRYVHDAVVYLSNK